MTQELELEALRLLVQRMYDPRGRRGIIADLGLFAHLGPWADALAGKLKNGDLTPAEAVAIAKAVNDKIGGIEAEAIGQASANPPEARGHLEVLKAGFARTKQAGAVTAAARAAEVATLAGEDPLTAMLKAGRAELAKVRRDEVPPLGELYARALEREKAAKEGKSGFRVDPQFAGTMADWLNNWAGPAGIYTAGRTALIGAPSSGGKTTLGNVYACSAIKAGLPVLYWQAELSPEEHLADLARCWHDVKRSDSLEARALPKEMADRLQYPRLGADLRNRASMIEQIGEWADMNELSRKPGNDCLGVVVLDYLQLLEDTDQRSDFKAVEVAASTLAQIAAERGLVAVILSQASKGSQGTLSADLKPTGTKEKTEDQKDQARRTFSESCFAGADVRRVAHFSFAAMIEEYRDNAPAIRCLYKSKDRGAKDPHKAEKIRWTMTASGRLAEEDIFPTTEQVKAKPKHNNDLSTGGL